MHQKYSSLLLTNNNCENNNKFYSFASLKAKSKNEEKNNFVEKKAGIIENNLNIDNTSTEKINKIEIKGIIDNTHNNNSFLPISTKNFNSHSLDTINITTLLSQNNVPISISNLYEPFDQFEPSKHSIKSLSKIRSYSANTHQGIIR